MRPGRMVLLNMRPDTPGAAAERARARAAGERAHADALSKFGELTAVNAGDFVKWQSARMKELLEE
jgi:hypothetical protein